MVTWVSWEGTAVSDVSSAVIRTFSLFLQLKAILSPLGLLEVTHLALEGQIWGAESTPHPVPSQGVRLSTLHLPGLWLGYPSQ